MIKVKKNILLVFLILLFITSCKTFSLNEAIKPEYHNFNKLPRLEAIYESEQSIKTISNTGDVVRINYPHATLFYREVDENISTPYGKKKGRIILTPILNQADVNMWWYYGTGLFAFIPSVFGVPQLSFTDYCELEVRILDNNGDLVKKYRADAKDTKYVTMWWGYSRDDASKASFYTSYKKALNKIVEKIGNDYEYLSSKLK